MKTRQEITEAVERIMESTSSTGAAEKARLQMIGLVVEMLTDVRTVLVAIYGELRNDDHSN